MNLSLLGAAQAEPERWALVDRDATISYHQLAREAGRAAGWVSSRRTGTGPVAVVASNDLSTAIVLHALVALGIPALLVHPASTPSERGRLASRAGASLVIHSDLYRELADVPAAPLPLSCPDDERPLAIVPTSGTEGADRLVVLSRRAFLASARASALNLGWEPADAWLVWLPLAHIGGFSILTRCLQGRRTAVLCSPRETGRAIESLQAGRVTLVSAVPTQLARLLKAWPEPTPPARLRALLLGGDAVPRDLVERAQAWPVLTTYGLTETCSQVTCEAYRSRPSRDRASGFPLQGTEIRVIDGRICVRSQTLCSGYWRDERPALDRDGWLLTGDLGHIRADGQLCVIGRASDLIVTGGENVFPAEVESVLQSMAGIEAACVFGVEDASWGQVVAAALVATGPRPPTHRELQTRLDAELARFKHPREIAWVQALETGKNGKLDRAKTRELTRHRLLPLDAAPTLDPE